MCFVLIAYSKSMNWPLIGFAQRQQRRKQKQSVVVPSPDHLLITHSTSSSLPSSEKHAHLDRQHVTSSTVQHTVLDRKKAMEIKKETTMKVVGNCVFTNQLDKILSDVGNHAEDIGGGEKGV